MIGVVAVVHPHDAGGPRYREMELGRGRWNDVASIVDYSRVEIHNVRWIRHKLVRSGVRRSRLGLPAVCRVSVATGLPLA